jgi:hypothetical protein
LRAVLAVVWVLCQLGCQAQGPQKADVASPEIEPLPPGTELPATIEGLLLGSEQGCAKDGDCAGKICRYNRCAGILQADGRWMQETLAARLAQLVDKKPALKTRISTWLLDITGREGVDVAFQARAVLVLEKLADVKSVATFLKGKNKRIREAAALALVRLRDSRGLDVVAQLIEHEQPTVAVEATRALGESRLPGALKPLLRNLNPSLDNTIVKASVVALGRLNDKRAIRPLVTFLAQAPAHLIYDITLVLRQLTGVSHGEDARTWSAWVNAKNPPAAPVYIVRQHSAQEDLGIPDP